MSETHSHLPQRAHVTADTPRESPHTPAALLALLADGQELSGSALAMRLGVTRAAVWKQIEQLRALGLTIHAVAGRGYRLVAPIELLDASRIAAAVSPEQRDRVGEIEVLWQIDSTNSALARGATSSSSPRACLAEIQTHGRGRRGRAWQMPLAGGLALSFFRRFEGGMASLSGLSLLAGIAVLRALGDCGVQGAGLKWPNDVVVEGRKLAGILVELGGDALGPCHAIIGIGINLRIDPMHGAAIDQPWSDLATLTGERIPSRNLLAGRVLSRLAEALDTFASAGFSAFESEYAGYDALRNRPIAVLSGGDSWVGIAKGVNSRGALRAERDGVEIELDSADVRVRDREAVS
jgi:BirA family biotin operon repressor/biotin-[acetyl-CoA-carboxylase] ligase